MNQARKVTENYHSKIKVQFCHVRAHDIRVAFDKFLFRRVQPPFDIFRKDSTKLPSEALQPMCTVVPGPQKPLWQYHILLDWVIVSTNLDTNHHVHQIKHSSIIQIWSNVTWPLWHHSWQLCFASFFKIECSFLVLQNSKQACIRKWGGYIRVGQEASLVAEYALMMDECSIVIFISWRHLAIWILFLHFPAPNLHITI